MLKGYNRAGTLCKNERPDRPTVGSYQPIIAEAISCKARRSRQTQSGYKERARRDIMGMPNRSTMVGFTQTICPIPNLPPVFPKAKPSRDVGKNTPPVSIGFEETREDRYNRMFYRRHFCECQKGGLDIGKTKRGKGTKVMAIADAHGLPIAIRTHRANTHEVKLVEPTIDARFIKEKPTKIIGDLAYDSDPLDNKLKRRKIELIAPHKCNRRKRHTQDKRKLRRYCRRWKIERLFAWIQNFRRCVVRYDYHTINYLGFIQFACVLILLKSILR